MLFDLAAAIRLQLAALSSCTTPCRSLSFPVECARHRFCRAPQICWSSLTDTRNEFRREFSCSVVRVGNFDYYRKWDLPGPYQNLKLVAACNKKSLKGNVVIRVLYIFMYLTSSASHASWVAPIYLLMEVQLTNILASRGSWLSPPVPDPMRPSSHCVLQRKTNKSSRDTVTHDNSSRFLQENAGKISRKHKQ